jgi:hypothetical protein
VLVSDRVEDIEACSVRQREVNENDVRLIAGDHVEPSRQVGGLFNSESLALQRICNYVSNPGIVVNDQHQAHNALDCVMLSAVS